MNPGVIVDRDAEFQSFREVGPPFLAGITASVCLVGDPDLGKCHKRHTDNERLGPASLVLTTRCDCAEMPPLARTDYRVDGHNEL